MGISKKTVVKMSTLLFMFMPGVGLSQEMVFPGTEWETATPGSQGVDSSLLQAAVDYLDDSLPAGGGINELVISRNGRIIWEGPESDNVHLVYSMTKSFATTTLGLLVDEDFLSVDTLASDYVPNLVADYPDVTLRHLATHTSGYRPEGEPYPLPPELYWDLVDPFTPGPPLFTPDSRYLYSLRGMEQMMNVLTRVAGEPMQDFFQQRIGGPIGLDSSAWDWYDFPTSDGLTVEAGSWGISMSAKDAARLGHLFLNQGNWSGEQLISSDWVNTATSVQVPVSLQEHPNTYSVPLGGVYGYGWWLNDVGADGKRLYPAATHGTYAALGRDENNTFVIPEWNMVITREGTGWPQTAEGAWSNFLGLVGFAVGQPPSEMFLGPTSTYQIVDGYSDSNFDGHGDVSYDGSSSQWAVPGEFDSVDNNGVAKLISKFRLPSIPDTSRFLESAELRLYLEDVEGVPSGPLSLLHSITDNDETQEISDYEDTSYNDTLLDLIQPTDQGQAYYMLDVTDLVLADYAFDGDSPQSAFRLQVDGASFFEDDQSNYYLITMPGSDTNHPELVLNFFDSPLLTADFNADDTVDGDDLSQWEGDFGGFGSDADGDSDSDGADFLAWQRQFGSGVASLASNVTVPEPSAVMLMFLGNIGLVFRCRRRRSYSKCLTGTCDF